MNDRQPPLKIAVIGVGRMGKHHARIYHGMSDIHLVAVVDRDADRVAAVGDQFDCDDYTTIQQLLDDHPNLDAASIAVPTVDHSDAASPILKKGIACLIEKPLAPTVEQGRQLAALASDRGAILQVGHTERFNPAIQTVTNMNMRPRFIEVARISPMTFRSLDIGVVMDMMIHDLDIVLLLAGSPLSRVDATGVSVLSEHEDVANARLVFESGCVANLTASRLAFKNERKLRVFSEDTYVSLDYTHHSGVVIRKSNNASMLEDLRNQLVAGADLANLDYAKLVQVEQLAMETFEQDIQGDPLTAQLTSFTNAVRQGHNPEVDATAGYTAVEAAERVVTAIRNHKWEGLASTRV